MNSKAIGQRLVKLRKELGQSRAYVARKLGISYSAMCAYESGIHIPKDDLKLVLASYYGVSVEYLFFATDEYEK